MNLSAEEIAALESGAQRIALFFWLGTDQPVRLWLGIGKIEPGLNAIDQSGYVYRGFGGISYIPALTQLINGQAERVEFELSGVSPEILALAASEDAEAVKNRSCTVGVGLFRNDWSGLLGPIHWIRRYRADFLAFDESLAEGPEDPVQRKIALSVGSAGTGRWRPNLAFFTDQDQQARSPGDRFCERTTAYSNNARKVWPDF